MNVMKYLKYSLFALAAVALIAVIVASIYAVLYFGDKSAAVQQQYKEAADQASLLKPAISYEGINCNIPADAKTQNYSVTIRTAGNNISARQQQIESAIKSAGGTITSSGQYKTNDRDAGYGTYASISAIMPLEQTDRFVAQLKAGVSSPDYTEDEYNNTQDANSIKQNCNSNLDAIKNFRGTEMLYLSQLKNQTAEQPQPMIFGVTPAGKMDLITRSLSDLRQNASAYKTTIDNVLNQVNKAGVNITIKEIPG